MVLKAAFAALQLPVMSNSSEFVCTASSRAELCNNVRKFSNSRRASEKTIYY